MGLLISAALYHVLVGTTRRCLRAPELCFNSNWVALSFARLLRGPGGDHAGCGDGAHEALLLDQAV